MRRRATMQSADPGPGKERLSNQEFASVLRLPTVLHRHIFLQPSSLQSCLRAGCCTQLACFWQPLCSQPLRSWRWMFFTGIAEALYPWLSTVSITLVFLNAISPVAAAISPLQRSWCHFLLFQEDESSASPLGKVLALCCTVFFPILHLLSFLHREVSALISKVRLATFLSDPFPFSFPSGASSLLFWLHNQCNYLSDDFLDFPSAQNRHLWALLLINVF